MALTMATLRAINLGVRFLLELASLASVAYWGWNTRFGVGAAVVLPLLVTVFWGLFVSPKAQFPTGVTGRTGLGLLVFLIAAFALYDRGQVSLAINFAAIATISSLLSYALPQ